MELGMSSFLLQDASLELQVLIPFRFERFQEHELVKPRVSYSKTRGLR